MQFFRYFMCVLIGFGSGFIISGAVFAFIAVIGIVPRLAQKTRTEKHIKFFEEAIIAGGIIGSAEMLFNFYLPIGKVLAVLFATASGVFIGCLAVSLAEVINVMPILMRRSNLKKGINFFVYALAIGKLVGSLLYYFIPGFYTM